MNKSKFYEVCQELADAKVVGINVGIIDDGIVVRMCAGDGDLHDTDFDSFLRMLQCYACITESLSMTLDIPRHQLYALAEEIAQHEAQLADDDDEDSETADKTAGTTAIPIVGNVVPFTPRARA